MVPNEILEKILRAVSDSKPTLLSCCLVSRTFAAFGQAQLFRNVELYSGRQSLRARMISVVSAFLAAISGSSHLASYVKRLALIGPTVLKDQALPAVLSTQGLTVQQLLLNGSGIDPMRWKEEVTPELEQALVSHQFSSVLELELQRILYMPFHLFSGCVNLRRLTLDYVTSIPQSQRQAGYTSGIPLETVVLDQFEVDDFPEHGSLAHFLHPDVCPKLANITFLQPHSMGTGDPQIIAERFILPFRRSLLQLDLGPWPFYDDISQADYYIGLSELRCLKFLTFSLADEVFEDGALIPASAEAGSLAARFVQRISNDLKRVTEFHALEWIQVHVSRNIPTAVLQSQLPSEEWTHLDGTLNSGLFTSFQGLRLLFPEGMKPENVEIMENWLREAIPRSSLRNLKVSHYA